ncbi:MAG: hypothetical protein CUN56_07580 [Phototrophicales bacterium]|nr:MAG: hypothetical protein CUN56_07580 [Phototrophicales bacterium]
MRRQFILWLWLLLLLSSQIVAQQQEQDDSLYPVIVVLNTNTRPESQLSSSFAVQFQRAQINTIQKATLRTLQNTPEIQLQDVTLLRTLPYIAMRVSDEGRRALEANPNVAAVYEDIPMPPATGSALGVIDAPQLHVNGYTGSGQIVVILDTGVDATHPALNNGKVTWQACFNTANGSTTLSACPNGTNTQYGGNAARPYPGACTGCDHGTHVAGIAAGRPTGASGYGGGVAPDAQIIAINIFTIFTTSQDCQPLPAPCTLSYISDQLEAFDYIAQLSTPGNTPYYPNIASVNMSLGGSAQYTGTCDGDHGYYFAPVDTLRSRGIAVIAASGNDGAFTMMGPPACVSNVISVAATDDSDNVAGFSNVSTALDFYAPGVSITSAVPGGGYANAQGTSMATPMVAGAWALMKQAFPAYTVTQIRDRLANTGVLIDDVSVQDKPRIDMDAAIIAPTATVQFSSTSSTATENNANYTVNLTLSVGATPPVIPGPSIPVTLNYSGSATRNVDYTAPDSVSFTQSSFNSGVYNASFDVTVLRDDVIDAGESITITLLDPSRTNVNLGSTTMHTINITDTNVQATGQVNMVYPNSTAGEAQGIINIPVRLTVIDGPPNITGTVTVNLSYSGSASRNVDYTAPDSITFNASSYAAGQYDISIPVTLIDRPGEQGSRDVIITLDSESHPHVNLGIDTSFTLSVVDMAAIQIDEQMLFSAMAAQIAAGDYDIQFVLVDFTPSYLAFTVRLEDGTLVTLNGIINPSQGMFTIQYQNILVNGQPAAANVVQTINSQLPRIVTGALESLMIDLGGPFNGVFSSTLNGQIWDMVVLP